MNKPGLGALVVGQDPRPEIEATGIPATFAVSRAVPMALELVD